VKTYRVPLTVLLEYCIARDKEYDGKLRGGRGEATEEFIQAVRKGQFTLVPRDGSSYRLPLSVAVEMCATTALNKASYQRLNAKRFRQCSAPAARLFFKALKGRQFRVVAKDE